MNAAWRSLTATADPRDYTRRISLSVPEAARAPMPARASKGNSPAVAGMRLPFSVFDSGVDAAEGSFFEGSVVELLLERVLGLVVGSVLF